MEIQKKLKEAEILKEQAKSNQQKQAIELMKSLKTRERFKAYLKAGKLKEAKVEAAKMLQSAWKMKLAKRKAQQQKELRIKLLEEAYAKKLQSRWRVKMSREKVRRMRIEKQRLRETGAAIMLQSSWRIKKARQQARVMREKRQRLLDEGAALMLQSAWRRKKARVLLGEKRVFAMKLVEAKVLIGRFLLPLLAIIRTRRAIMNRTLMLLVDVKNAKGLNAMDITGASDPYVYVHAERPKFSKLAPVLTLKSTSSSDTLSLYKSKVISSNLNPVWNEVCLAANLTGHDDIVITVIDHDKVGLHDFLGQVVVRLSEFPKLFSGKSIDFTLPLKPISRPVHDFNGKEIKFGRADNVKGQITFSLSLPPQRSQHACWMKKETKGTLGMGVKVQFKRRYVIVANGKISYFTDTHSLSEERGHLNGKDVTLLGFGPDRHGGESYFIRVPKDFWALKYCEEETEVGKQAWMRKCENSCPTAAAFDAARGVSFDGSFRRGSVDPASSTFRKVSVDSLRRGSIDSVSSNSGKYGPK